MKLNIKNSMLCGSLLIMGALATGCNGWLGEDSPGTTKLDDFYVNGEAYLQVVDGCYTPLAWDYNDTYYPEWMIGDIASDDALKGGQNVADGAEAYEIDNFKTTVNNTILLDYYRAKYQGIARCNQALERLPLFQGDDKFSVERRDCMLGEVYFLRAFYYFQLVRVFGGVPLIDRVIDSADDWSQERASAEQIYELIISDLLHAESLLWDKNKFTVEDLGRATKGAASAMLCKVYLYMHDYNNAYLWGKDFVDNHYKSGKYSLCPVYTDNFTLDGENGPESVFEIQYAEYATSSYGGNGFTVGTFSSQLTRPRMSKLEGRSGWGWNHPTQNLYDEFEEGDIRREASIGVPDAASALEAEVNYLGSPYYNNKTSYSEGGTFPPLAHHSRGPLNYRLIRASDVLLLYAEAALESGKDVNGAKWALEEVRARARRNATLPGALPQFPNYRGYSDNTASLREAIRHERRCELAMEGHRWFDLVRWGIAYQVMDKFNGSYGSTENEEVRAEMASFVPGKHELFPLPAEELTLNPMPQNPGY